MVQIARVPEDNWASTKQHRRKPYHSRGSGLDPLPTIEDGLAGLSRELRLRQEEQPRPIREIAWKAQLRLCARYRQLARSGKPADVVTAAIARELAGFIWAIARRVPPAAN